MNIKPVTNKIFLSFMLLMLAFNPSFAHKKEIAITIDDLPFVGEARNFHLNMMLNTMKEQQIPATGFIIAKEVRNDNWDMLQKFRDSGFGLGNHTYSHANLNVLETKDYIKEIKEADKILSPVLTEPKYFRYPYLAMSSGDKRNKILCYLAKKNYQVAPITIDSKDFVFNQRLLSVPEMNRRNYLGEMEPFYLDFIWQQTVKAEAHTEYHHNPDQAQILLIHANLLNAYVLPDIINLYKEKGYTFVSLEDALKTFKESAHCSTTNLKPKLIAQNKPKVNSVPETDNNIESFVDWD
jgi:peptidoglycan/xylan/chitin deacetylase (PgdA/CDA1 family)